MRYQRYFKPGQRLLLKTLPKEGGYIDLLTVYFDSGEGDTFALILPYGEDAVEQYPFSDSQTFEISSETFGLGLRLTGTFSQKLDGQRFALKVNSDLQMFQRRSSQRLDCQIGIRFTRGAANFKTLRDNWEKNIRVLQSSNAPLTLEGFNTCQANLSRSGIRFTMRGPANPAELCLMLIDLDDGLLPICALAEIVWSAPSKDQTSVACGMRFVNILEADQQRIDKFINQQKS